jgi:hypothetical protein
MIVMESARCNVRDPLSVTRIAKFEVPEPVGVPLISPLEASNDKPTGSDPDGISHAYGVVPPDAATVVEYPRPVMPLGNDIVVSESGGLVVIESACVTVREPLSVNRTVKFDVPAVVGVPVIAPDNRFKDSPGGNVPIVTAQVYGVIPPAPTRVAE